MSTSSSLSERLTQLDDYLSGVLPEEAASGVEEELFVRAVQGEVAEVEFIEQLMSAGRSLASQGQFDVGCSREQVERLAKSGRAVFTLPDIEPDRYYHVPDWPTDIDVVVTRVKVDLRGYERVEIVVLDAEDKPVKTMRDIQFDRTDGSFYMVCEPLLASWGFQQPHVRGNVTGVIDGERRVIARFEWGTEAR